jgi:hypothetical protein
MKSINKITASLFILCLFLGFASCTEEAEYTQAEIPSNVQVFFSNKLATKVELSPDLNVTSYEVELLRINKADELTVNLSVETESPDVFTVPATASFAAGSDATKIVISYDPSKLDYDDYKSIRIAVSDENQTSPYGSSFYAFTAGIPAPWRSLGKATFSDAWMFENSYEVEIQQHMLEPNRYRLVDPYTQGLNEEGYVPAYNKGNQSPFVEFNILPKGSVYKNVTTTIDGLVVYEEFYTGFYNTSNNYNTEVKVMHPSNFSNHTTEAFWTYNRVLQFSDSGEPEIVQLAPFYYMDGLGGWNYSQSDGVITIVFPGVVLADYSIEISYAGRYTDPAGNDFAIADVKLGADVEYAKVALVQGNLTQAGLNGILNGSIESVQIDANGKIQLPCSATGRYTYVAVSYAGDEAQNFDYIAFDFTASN